MLASCIDQNKLQQRVSIAVNTHLNTGADNAPISKLLKAQRQSSVTLHFASPLINRSQFQSLGRFDSSIRSCYISIGFTGVGVTCGITISVQIRGKIKPIPSVRLRR